MNEVMVVDRESEWLREEHEQNALKIERMSAKLEELMAHYRREELQIKQMQQDIDRIPELREENRQLRA